MDRVRHWLVIAGVLGALAVGGCGGKALVEGAGSSGASGNSGSHGSTSSGGGSSSGEPAQVRFVSVLAFENRGCLPQRLPRGADGTTSCSVIAALPQRGDSTTCAKYPGLSPAAAPFVDALRRTEGAAIDGVPICAVAQIPEAGDGTCVGDDRAGWCYVESGAGAYCPQQVAFTPTGNPIVGSKLWLACP